MYMPYTATVTSVAGVPEMLSVNFPEVRSTSGSETIMPPCVSLLLLAPGDDQVKGQSS